VAALESQKSIQQRLQFGLFSGLTIVFLALWAGTTWTIHSLVEQYLVTRLDHDTEQLLRHIHFKNGQLAFNQKAIEPIYLRPYSGHYYVILSGQQRLSSPSLNGYHLWTPDVPPENPYETLAPDEQGKERGVLVLFTLAQKQGHEVRVYVAENHLPIQQALQKFDVIFSAIALIVMMGMIGWVRRFLHKSLAPLQSVQSVVEQAQHQPEALNQLPENLPLEVAPLVQALRQTLTELHEQLERFRHANADLAHSLKTPLQVIFQILEDAQLNACPEVRQQLQQQAHRLQALMERTLKQARVSGTVLSDERFSLQADLSALMESLKRLYPNIEFKTYIDSIEQLPMEKEDGYELLGNLLDNACKWAQKRVFVRCEMEQEGVRLIVEDDGIGVPDEQLDALGQRGKRLDERRSENGIGLAVVQDIVNQYGAKLQFEHSQLGGLRIVITFL